MSLFGSLMGDLADDDFMFGHHMRQMNTMMNSIFSEPFSMLHNMRPHPGHHPALTNMPMGHHQALMPFGFPAMPNMGRLMAGPGVAGGGGFNTSFSSSSFVSMSHDPEGRQQVYQVTSSTKTGPDGLKEVKKTVQDSRTGLKKMAIGHHIGERGHIIEREQNYQTGHQEERQDFINLDEEEADDFNKEFVSRSHSMGNISGGQQRRYAAIEAPPATEVSTAPLAITMGPSSRPSPPTGAHHRRPIRSQTSSPLALSPATQVTSNFVPASVPNHPYHPRSGRRGVRPMKGSNNNYTNNPGCLQ